MKVRIHNIKMPLDAEWQEVKQRALQKIGKSENDCISFRVVKQSVDARKKQLCFVYSVDLELCGEKLRCDGKQISVLQEEEEIPILKGSLALKHQPVVVGSGPCGLFCALTLARQGYRPLLLERGMDVDRRTETVQSFWNGGNFNRQTNVQFGEGGAGTFSDGKLTTRISDARIVKILQEFVRFGAPEEILYRAKPHIGTDILKNVVKNIRMEILRLGGEVRFEAQVSELMRKNDRLEGVKLADGEEILCSVAVLALGHSARDTYEMLFRSGVLLEQKAFSVGVRAEHLQSEIDKAMYGEFAGHPKLGAADYQLSYRNGADACYSFCMCPGGVVVAAASEENTVVTNGMSYFARDRENANAAICVNVTEEDFASKHPLAGVAYQCSLEQKAFVLGGGNYAAPSQLVSDYLEKKKTRAFSKVMPSYLPQTVGADLNELFSPRVNQVLADGLRQFERKIKGYTKGGAVLTGVETRTSAPVRILRNESLQSVSLCGVYPAGEGAGYAGGIMSAAADGIRVAEKIVENYCFKDS